MFCAFLKCLMLFRVYLESIAVLDLLGASPVYSLQLQSEHLVLWLHMGVFHYKPRAESFSGKLENTET